jgi:hypothetical protein
LVSDIQPGDGKTANLFYSVAIVRRKDWSSGKQFAENCGGNFVGLRRKVCGAVDKRWSCKIKSADLRRKIFERKVCVAASFIQEDLYR